MVATAASIAAVRKDAELLSGSVDATAATLEETARSIKSVSTNAEELAAASEQLLALVTETSASVSEMSKLKELPNKINKSRWL